MAGPNDIVPSAQHSHIWVPASSGVEAGRRLVRAQSGEVASDRRVLPGGTLIVVREAAARRIGSI